ncbi:meiosis 1 arrest protein isoform X3 [Synchiropus splendidus]|uniref:meiosis 1 arrest protein isoform X3 n=1 Tax=Synchiropus splendidus TaxID=270530 RepID=UPI00237E4E45|nr:meiosis 1 arrest protein isoform X3 [Synchiropus splendidus]
MKKSNERVAEIENSNRAISSSIASKYVYWSSSFMQQPARVLIVEALPPCLEGPCRIPLLSLYAVSRQQECLLPFVRVRGNFARLNSCVEDLRSIPVEGCIRGVARGAEMLAQAVLDSLQQFKQYARHTGAGNQTKSCLTVEVTVLTSQAGRDLVQLLVAGLKDADLVPLKRLTVVQLVADTDWSQDSPEALHTENEGSLMLATEVDLQQVNSTIVAVETALKGWLHEQGGNVEHLHLLLPNTFNSPAPVCIKCDRQERLISPALIPVTLNLGVKTESLRDFMSDSKLPAHQSQTPQKMTVIKSLRASTLCESVMYGLPLVVRPTSCWQLDWDELETNHNLFHALCQTLLSQDLFLLLQVEPSQMSTSVGLYSHYVLQASPTLTLLLKPVASRELLLPCPLVVPTQDPTAEATQTIMESLSRLDQEALFNPLTLSNNLYQHLRSLRLTPQPRYPYRLQSPVRRSQPHEGARAAGLRQQRQHNQTRHTGLNNKIQATVAPYSPSSCYPSHLGPPPAKVSRPSLRLLTRSRSNESPHAALCPVESHKDESLS